MITNNRAEIKYASQTCHNNIIVLSTQTLNDTLKFPLLMICTQLE